VTRILLTGAAGFIGSHLAEALLSRGDEVVGIDNFDPFYPRAVKLRNLAAARGSGRFELHERDLRAPGLDALLDRDTVVVHLAARAGVRPSLLEPAEYASCNVAATAALADAAARQGAVRFVFASSSSVYGDDTPAPCAEDAPAVGPVSPYAASKRGAELMLEAMAPHGGLRVASLRLFTVYGPRQRPDLAIHAFARRIAAGQPVTLYGDGTARRDYTYVADMVAGLLAAIDWTEGAPVGVRHFNLAGGEPVGLLDMVETLAAALGKAPQIEHAPPQPGDVRHTAADLTRSRAELGYAPATPFSEGIRRFAEWFKEEYATERR